MSVLSVVYSLNSQYQDYSGFHALIEEFIHLKLSKEVYLIQTKLSPRAVYEELRPHINAEDTLLISRMRAPWHAHAKNDVIDWMAANLK